MRSTRPTNEHAVITPTERPLLARKPFDVAALAAAVAEAEGEDVSEVSVKVTVPLGPTDVVTDGGGVDVGSLADVEVDDVPAEADADDEVVADDVDVEELVDAVLLDVVGAAVLFV